MYKLWYENKGSPIILQKFIWNMRHVCIIVTYETLMISNVFILLNCLYLLMSFIVNCRIVSGKIVFNANIKKYTSLFKLYALFIS